MDGFEILIPLVGALSLFIGLPWIVFHYITKWKSAATLTKEDENLLDELHEIARRLDERMCSIERILGDENPGWRQVACDPIDRVLDDRSKALDAPVPLRSNQPERRPR